MKMLSRSAVVCVGFLAVAMAGFVALRPASPALFAADAKADPALDRTREQVKMLDELYKNAVISVNAKYDGPPAIKMAKDVFAAMKSSGWHDAKLVDATGTPQNEANLPQTDFEKRAAEAMKAGKPYYDEVTGLGNDRKLFAATVVPAVHKKCATCHSTKVGDLLGFIRYEIPVK